MQKKKIRMVTTYGRPQPIYLTENFCKLKFSQKFLN